jgi:hypothetical protein
MKIIEEPITDKIINTYKDELFLLGETKDELKDKHIIKMLNENNELVSIAMYSKLEHEEIELYLNEDQKNSIENIISQGIYLDAVTSLKRGYNACKDIISYLLEKSRIIWCYSHIQAVGFWRDKMEFIEVGESIFINQLGQK